jgi:hypothetical protein
MQPENSPSELVLKEIINSKGIIKSLNNEPIGPEPEDFSLRRRPRRLTIELLLPGKSTTNKYIYELSEMEAHVAWGDLVDLYKEQSGL